MTAPDVSTSQSQVEVLPQTLRTTNAPAMKSLPSPDQFDIGHDGAEDFEAGHPKPKAKPGPVTWMSLPRKDQLAILFLCRFVDFLQVASLQAYVFYQLKFLDSSLSDAQVSTQAGLLQGCFTGAQVLTAILWGKAADASWCGRKWVILIGLGGTALSCVGYGFATSFFWAAFWRAIGGGINGIVGIIRTMISEITKEKKYQSRAFLILPMSFNVAGIIGPIMGGFLADPANTLPGLFGQGSIFGFQWLQDYPYALPSLLNALFLAVVTGLVFLFLEETSKVRVDKFDPGLYIASRIKQVLSRSPEVQGYSEVQTWDRPEVVLDYIEPKIAPVSQPQLPKPAKQMRQLPFGRIWTRNVVLTLITTAFYDFHLGAFANLWALFLSTPRPAADSMNQARSLVFNLTGGLGMPSSRVGVASSFLGLIGMLLQITLYPPISARLGTLRSFQWFLIGFPIAYFIAPYLAVLPSSTAPPEPASGALIWIGIILLLLLHTNSRTFTLPANIILLNNCSPHPSVLGTVHGIGQSVSACFRTVGPVVGGWWYGLGLDCGMVEAGWWGLAVMAILGCCSAVWVYEGSGHEIYLEGEEEDDHMR